MSTVETLKADLAAEHARYSEEFERDTRKLFALARIIDTEQELRELEACHE